MTKKIKEICKNIYYVIKDKDEFTLSENTHIELQNIYYNDTYDPSIPRYIKNSEIRNVITSNKISYVFRE